MNPYHFNLFSDRLTVFGLFGILVAIFCTFLATVAFLSEKTKLYLLLGFFNISVAFWGIGAFIVGSTDRPDIALIGWKISNFGGYFISIFFYHLVCKFCHLNRLPIIIFGYAQAFVFNYFSFFTDHVFNKTRFVYGLYYHEATFLYASAVGVFLVLVFLSFLELFAALYRSNNERRTQILYVIIGFAFGFGLGSTILLSSFKIDLFYPVGNVGICVYVLVLTFGIFRYHLFDLEKIALAFQREKLAAIGLITASVNHEIRNPLYAAQNILDSYIENEKEGLELKNPIEISKKAKTQIARALDVITKLNRFAKPFEETKDSRQKTQANIQEAFKNVLDLISYEFQLDKIRIINQIDSNLPLIQADQRQLEEILLNLILNACHAMEKGGELVIASECLSSPNAAKQSALSFPQSLSGNLDPRLKSAKIRSGSAEKFGGHSGMTGKIQIIIQDTGSGISKDQMRHLFEPFHTTKGEKGTGLGLYITKQLVERNGGKISVNSKEGKGTSFSLEFKQ